MATADLQILLKAKNETSAAFSAVEKDATSLGSKMGSALKVGGLVAAAGIGAAGFALVSFVKMAADEQAGIERLKTSVASTGVAYETYAKQIDVAVRAGEKLAFQDDEVRDSLSLLTIQTGSVEEAMNRQKIAMDLARGTGMDLALASKLVGKVSDENTQVLKKYGIAIADGATETEALEEIQRRFAGQSETFAGTATAKWAIFNNQMDNVKESIGSALLPLVTQIGTALGDFLTAHQADIDAFSQMMAEKIPEGLDAIKRGFEAIKPELTAVVQQFKDAWPTIQTGLQWVVDNKPILIAAIIAIGAAMLIAFTPVTLPILAVVAALALITVALGMNEEDWKKFGIAVDKVWEDLQKAIEEKLGFLGVLINSALDHYRNLFETAFFVIRDIVKIVMALLSGDWGAAWEGIKSLFGHVMEGITTEIKIKLALWRDIFALAWEGIKLLVTLAWEALKQLVVMGMEATQQGIVNAWEATRAWFADLPFKITTAIGDLGGVLYNLAKNAMSSFIRGIIDGAKSVGQTIYDNTVGKIPGSGRFMDSLIPGSAAGGMVPLGWSTINEQGPELLYNSGSSVRVVSNRESQKLVQRDRSAGDMHFHGNIILPNVLRPQDFGRDLMREQDRMFRGVA